MFPSYRIVLQLLADNPGYHNAMGLHNFVQDKMAYGTVSSSLSVLAGTGLVDRRVLKLDSANRFRGGGASYFRTGHPPYEYTINTHGLERLKEIGDG